MISQPGKSNMKCAGMYCIIVEVLPYSSFWSRSFRVYFVCNTYCPYFDRDPYDILGDEGTINKFYNNPAVQDALHARPIKWYGCVSEGTLLKYDKPLTVVPYIAELLDDAGLRILFYNGDRDLLCAFTGTEMMLESMKWSSTVEWKHAPRGVWMVDEGHGPRVAGYTKALGNLEFVTVYNSGHMMSHNQPARALDMVKRFLKGETLLDVKLPSYPRVQEDNHKKMYFTGTVMLAIVIFLSASLFLAHRWRGSERKRGVYEELSSTDNSELGDNDKELTL